MSDYGNFKRQIIAPLKTGQEKIYNYTKKDKKHTNTQKKQKNIQLHNPTIQKRMGWKRIPLLDKKW